MLLTTGRDPSGFQGLRVREIYLVLCKAEVHLASIKEYEDC